MAVSVVNGGGGISGFSVLAQSSGLSDLLQKGIDAVMALFRGGVSNGNTLPETSLLALSARSLSSTDCTSGSNESTPQVIPGASDSSGICEAEALTCRQVAFYGGDFRAEDADALALKSLAFDLIDHVSDDQVRSVLLGKSFHSFLHLYFPQGRLEARSLMRFSPLLPFAGLNNITIVMDGVFSDKVSDVLDIILEEIGIRGLSAVTASHGFRYLEGALQVQHYPGVLNRCPEDWEISNCEPCYRPTRWVMNTPRVPVNEDSRKLVMYMLSGSRTDQVNGLPLHVSQSILGQSFLGDGFPYHDLGITKGNLKSAILDKGWDIDLDSNDNFPHFLDKGFYSFEQQISSLRVSDVPAYKRRKLQKIWELAYTEGRLEPGRFAVHDFDIISAYQYNPTLSVLLPSSPPLKARSLPVATNMRVDVRGYTNIQFDLEKGGFITTGVDGRNHINRLSSSVTYLHLNNVNAQHKFFVRVPSDISEFELVCTGTRPQSMVIYANPDQGVHQRLNLPDGVTLLFMKKSGESGDGLDGLDLERGRYGQIKFPLTFSFVTFFSFDSLKGGQDLFDARHYFHLERNNMILSLPEEESGSVDDDVLPPESSFFIDAITFVLAFACLYKVVMFTKQITRSCCGSRKGDRGSVLPPGLISDSLEDGVGSPDRQRGEDGSSLVSSSLPPGAFRTSESESEGEVEVEVEVEGEGEGEGEASSSSSSGEHGQVVIYDPVVHGPGTIVDSGKATSGADYRELKSSIERLRSEFYALKESVADGGSGLDADADDRQALSRAADDASVGDGTLLPISSQVASNSTSSGISTSSSED